MNARRIRKGSYEYWQIDLRAVGEGRVQGATKAEAEERARKILSGAAFIEITMADKLAKKELVEAMGERATLHDAVRYYIASQGAVKVQKALGDAIPECVAEKVKNGKRPAYTAHLGDVLGRFKKLTGADTLCGAITKQHIVRFFDSHPWEPVTKHGMRNRLAAFFEYCISKGYASMNPTVGVELPTVERKEPKILSVEDVHRLLDTALYLDPAMVPYYVLGIFCGIRPEELQRLPADCVQLDTKTVNIPAHVAKTRKKRLVDLSDNALAWLKAANKPIAFVRFWHRAIYKLARVELSSDVMRHTFASYHIAVHGSADKAALQMGHEGNTRMLFKHYYNGSITKDAAETFWKIEPAQFPLRVLPMAVNL